MATLNPVNIGSAPNDNTGDPIRDSFSKVNANDAALNNDIALRRSIPVDLDLGGAATAGFPTGDAAGVAYRVVNANAAGTAVGAANPITVLSGDLVEVRDGVTASTDDGADWWKVDNQAAPAVHPDDDVESVGGAGVDNTDPRNPVVQTAAPGVEGTIDLDTVEKQRVFADDTTVGPATAGSPTIGEMNTWAALDPGARFDRLAFYTGTDTNTDPITHVFMIDGGGQSTLVQAPSAAADTSIYSDDGTLTGARTVTMDGNDLELVGDNAQRSTLFRHQGLHDALQWRAKQQGFVFGAGTFTPDLTQYGQMTVGIADTDVGDLTVAPPTIDAFEGYADRYEFSVGNTDTVARNVVFDTHYKDNQGNALGTQVVQPGSYRHWNFHYQGGLLAGSYLDSELVVPSAAVATVIDSSAAPVVETLPAATGSGAIRFYANEDVTNTATLAPASGEQLNGVTDGTFLFSNYSSGTQFRADDIATGQWVVSAA